MQLPDSYTIKISAIPAYFDAMLDAQPPERFSVKFLENLGFTSTNDRLFIGILKSLGFLNQDGTPQSRYFEFLDKSRSKQVLATGIKESFAGLFAINVRANEMSADEARNKLRTLYAGTKTDLVIGNVAKTFRALCDYADFSAQPLRTNISPSLEPQSATEIKDGGEMLPVDPSAREQESLRQSQPPGRISVSGLQYHINIVLPDTKDQGVYDAIFKSLREHLG
jgi:hypothetical protein